MTPHIVFNDRRVLAHRIISEFKISHVRNIIEPPKLYGLLLLVKIRMANVCPH